MDLGGGDALLEDVGAMHSITLSLDEDGGMGNSSTSSHQPTDSQFATQQLTADDSRESEADMAEGAAETDTGTAASAQSTAAADDIVNGAEAATETEHSTESIVTSSDMADTAAADTASATALPETKSDIGDAADTEAPPPSLLAPPSPTPPSKKAAPSPTPASSRIPTSSTTPSGPHGNTLWEVEKLVEQRESKGHIWFRVKWKEFNTMTWEEEKNLHNCEQLIREFRQKAGLPTGDNGGEGEENDEEGQEEEAEAEAEESTQGRRGRKRKNANSTAAARGKKVHTGRAATGGRRAKAADQSAEEAKEEGEDEGAQEGEDEKDGAGKDEDEEDEAPEYEVESIISHIVDDVAVTFYEVKWKGYKKPTWEPEVNLVGCDELLAEYKQKHITNKPPTKPRAKKPAKGKARKFTATKRKQPPKANTEEGPEVADITDEHDAADEQNTKPDEKKAEARARKKKGTKVSEPPEDESSMAVEEKDNSAEADGDEEKESAEDNEQPRSSKQASLELKEPEEHKEPPGRATTTAHGRKGKGTGGNSGAEADGGEEEEESEEGKEQEAGVTKTDYEVESILDVDLVPPEDSIYGSVPLFMVKWKDWPTTASTWEPAAHFSNQGMIAAFLKDRGLDPKVLNGGARPRSTRTVDKVRVR